jgi:ketosteroid isomerase-like protein
MGNEIEALAREMYAAITRRDFDAVEARVHPDVVAESLVMEPEATVYRGRGGMRQYMDDLFEVFPDWRGEVDDVEELGDWALVLVHVSGHAASSGVEVDERAWGTVRFQDGLLAEVRFFRTESEARDAMVSRF